MSRYKGTIVARMMMMVCCLSFYFALTPLTAAEASSKLSSHELLLYYSPSCPYSRQVLKYLEDQGITIPMCDVKKDMEGKKKLKSYGEPARVPCLVIDGKPLYDSGAIIQWLLENATI